MTLKDADILAARDHMAKLVDKFGEADPALLDIFVWVEAEAEKIEAKQSALERARRRARAA